MINPETKIVCNRVRVKQGDWFKGLAWWCRWKGLNNKKHNKYS